MEHFEFPRRPDVPMKLTVRHSSRDRHWSGFRVGLYDVAPGFAEMERFTDHNVTMTTGSPVMATCRCAGQAVRRLQRPGDLGIVPAGYGGAWEDEGPTSILIADVSPQLVRSAADAMGVPPDRCELQPYLALRDPLIEHVAWALKAELETEEPLGRLYADSLGVALAAQLVRRCARVAGRPLPGGLSERRLRRVTDYVNEHLANDLSLGELANVAGSSPSHFKTLFKRSTGVPVHNFVMRTRVDRAIAMLPDRALSINDIALAVGFSSGSHLARCVRRMTGLTPAAIRRDA